MTSKRKNKNKKSSKQKQRQSQNNKQTTKINIVIGKKERSKPSQQQDINPLKQQPKMPVQPAYSSGFPFVINNTPPQPNSSINLNGIAELLKQQEINRTNELKSILKSRQNAIQGNDGRFLSDAQIVRLQQQELSDALAKEREQIQSQFAEQLQRQQDFETGLDQVNTTLQANYESLDDFHNRLLEQAQQQQKFKLQTEEAILKQIEEQKQRDDELRKLYENENKAILAMVQKNDAKIADLEAKKQELESRLSTVENPEKINEILGKIDTIEQDISELENENDNIKEEIVNVIRRIPSSSSEPAPPPPTLTPSKPKGKPKPTEAELEQDQESRDAKMFEIKNTILSVITLDELEKYDEKFRKIFAKDAGYMPKPITTTTKSKKYGEKLSTSQTIRPEYLEALIEYIKVDKNI